MKAPPRISRSIRLIINSLGLACLGSAIFLQVLVFWDILEQGYFRAVEANSAILSIEIALTVFAALYFIYVFQKVVHAVD